MIKSVTTYRSGKNKNIVKYTVNYGSMEKKYTNDNLPKTVKEFMQTHAYEHATVFNGLIFR